MDRLEEKVETLEQSKGKKKNFRLPRRVKSLAKRADKSMTHVLVQYLTAKQQVEFKLCPVVSGNIVVINNKAHVLDPRRVWRHKKHIWYIIREIDRQPVSNLDLNKIKARKDDTEADVPLIKAVLGAVQKQKTIESRSIWIIIIIAIIAIVAGMIIFGGG